MDSNAQTPLRQPWLIAVWPGMGSVAAVAGSHLIDTLKPQPAGMVPQRRLFTVNHVDVHGGIARSGPLPRSMFFTWRDPKGHRDLVIFLGEAQPAADRGHALCHRIIDFAKRQGVQRVVTFAAMGTQLHPEAAPRVFGAVTVPSLLDSLGEAGVQPLKEGRIGGLNGSLLGAAAHRGVEAMCLLGEMPFFAAGVINPRSSLRVLEAFSRLSGIELDVSRLAELADEVEPQLTALYEQVRRQADRLAEQGLVFEGMEDQPEDERESASKPEQAPELDVVSQQHIEELFNAADRDRTRVDQLKQELDRLGVFEQYEDRFLDLFRRAG